MADSPTNVTDHQMPEVTHVYDAQLVAPVDGDSFYVRLDTKLDRNTGSEMIVELRLLGLNCPEVHGAARDAGLRAAAFTTLFLQGSAPSKEVWPLVVQTFGREKYGRTLARVWRKSDGGCLNDQLLSSGNAVPYMVLQQLREAHLPLSPSTTT